MTGGSGREAGGQRIRILECGLTALEPSLAREYLAADLAPVFRKSAGGEMRSAVARRRARAPVRGRRSGS